MRDPYYVPTSLAWGRGGRARWARVSSRAAIVFVHGYRGDSVETWLHFPSLIVKNARLHGHDLIYFGYESGHRADANASELATFLTFLAESPATSVINPTLPPHLKRDDRFTYTRLVIFAHSLGAVVSRLALLKAASVNTQWLSKISLVLFAPAHLGADVLQLIREFVLGPIVLPVMEWRHPVLIDLQKDSDLLRQLKSDTEKSLATNGPSPHVVARCVLHSPKDAVVSPARFCSDPDARWVETYRTHKTVCKPTEEAVLPFQLVADYL